MSDQNKHLPGEQDEEWTAVGGSAPKRTQASGSLVDDADQPLSEERVLGVRKPTTAGLISLRVGGIALAVMLAAYVFADVRDVEIGQRQIRIAYALSLIPALGILWSIIAFVKREEHDVRRAMVGLVLSLAAVGLAYGAIAGRPAEKAASQPAADDRTRLNEQDLTKWREQKLRRNPEPVEQQ